MRILLAIISLVAITACTPQIPNSGVPADLAVGATDTDQMPIDPLIDLGSPGISSEQDFGVVSGRETIESDAARIATNRQLYQIVEPTDLPTRTGTSTVSIVEYALATDNPVGQPMYNRSSFGSADRFTRNCAKFSSPDLAQEDFLKRGGPQRDSRGLDPDGDGFACGWTPEPYRQARASVVPVTPLVISNE